MSAPENMPEPTQIPEYDIEPATEPERETAAPPGPRSQPSWDNEGGALPRPSA